MTQKRRVYTLGETVYDLVFKNMQPVKGVPGGATLNSSVTLGRLGVPVSFISESGQDLMGNFIADFLSENGVDTRHVYRYPDGATTLAIAALDEKNNAVYNFYKIHPSQHLLIRLPEIRQGDIVLFGSFFAISPQLREPVLQILRSAKASGALLVYDPNFRLSHQDEIQTLKPYMLENMTLADIVRGSDEDFYHIFGARTPDEARKSLSGLCSRIVYTSSANGVTWMHPGGQGFVPSQKINPVSTIGAGDTFNAGLVYALLQEGLSSSTLPEASPSQWNTLAETGVAFASEVCLSYENYISKEFAGIWRKRSSQHPGRSGSAMKE